MRQSAKINEYLKVVCEQIRWEKAHSVISEELENHIIDQKNAFMADGLDEETAADRAIKEMGDPILVGSLLDRTHRPKIEWSIMILTGIALLIGIAIRIYIIYSLDTPLPLKLTNSIISAIIGIACMAIAYFTDFTLIGKYPKTIYFGLIIVIIVVMIFSPIRNGAFFYAKFILLLFPTAFAGTVYSMRSKGYLGIVLCGSFFIVPALLGMIIPSISSVGLYSFACLILLTLAIAKGWYNVNKLRAMLLVYIPAFSAITIILLAIFSSPYCSERLLTAINPYLDPMGGGWLGIKIRESIYGAKFIGQGELASNVGYILPSIDTDLLLTCLIHKLGWISFFIIATVISAFIIRSFMLCSRQKSVLGKLISTSVLITFTMQVAIYVVANLGFILFAPLTLPLISYGGTATIINMILIGIMLSVFKSGDLVRDKHTPSTTSKSKLFEIVDGKLIIDLNIKH